MIRKASEAEVVVNEKMRGGAGSVIVSHLAKQPELYDKSRLFAKLVIRPGCGIGYHVHENEMEAFYIISGVATYDDNGETVRLNPGDTSITLAGQGHSIVNNGEEDVVLIALIVMQ
jgi:mannose-6-phosphate isomerase-like protein (cupin superfamily)